MKDTTHGQVAKRYAEISYPSLVHPHTHPRRLAAVARLFGLRPPDPSKASILELGSCDGENLLWFASTLPQATLKGLEIDTASTQRALNKAQKKGLQNSVVFEAIDLLDKQFGDQTFDYIVAHGLFSWVDEPVQQRLMEVCRDHLTPSGIAMISYGVMPGCSTHEALRHLLLLELDDAERSAVVPLPKDTQLGAVDKVFSFFETAIAKSTKASHAPHAAQLLQSTETLRKKHPEVLLHDEAGAVCEPLYFLQFAQWAAETDLTYVADANFVHDWMDCFPSSLKKAIAQSEFSRLKSIQYADYVLNTHFRSSIVCHAHNAAHILSSPDLHALLELHIRPLTSEALLNEDKRSAGKYEQKLFDVIEQQGHRGMAFADAWQTTKDALQSSGEPSNEVYKRVARLVLEMVCAERLELSLGSVTP